MTAFTRIIDNTLYSRRALNEARSAYAKYCLVRASPDPHGTVGITVTVNPEFQQDAREITLEFWNFFLDTACQQRFDAS